MLIDEDSDGSLTKIKSRDVIFLENKFPWKREIDKELHLQEMDYPTNVTSNNQSIVGEISRKRS